MSEGRFSPCPDRPNCVSSKASDPSRYVAPLAYEGEREQAWLRLETVVRGIERAEVVENTGAYLQVTFESRLFGFVDDMEFQIDPPNRLIHMKSASRTGYYDLGVNRRRCEDIRQQFHQ